MEKVILVTGPTGIGKTSLAIALAKHYDTEIINGDAFQVYKSLDIGTAKPTLEERLLVPHHMIDILEATEEFSVATYQRLVREKIKALNESNKRPIVVGGSGLYIDAVIRDYRFEGPARMLDVETAYFGVSNEDLHAELSKLDYETSLEIHPNNRKRVLRAIELVKCASENESRQQAKRFVYDAVILFLTTERQALYRLLNQRVDRMIDQGLVEEARTLYHRGVFSQATQAIGYKELFSYFSGIVSLTEAIERIKQNTRNFAKRQITWFKNKTKGLMIEVDIDQPSKTFNEAVRIIDAHYSKENDANGTTK